MVGKNMITPKVREILIQRKMEIKQFFSKKYVELEAFKTVKDDNGKTKREKIIIHRWVAFCHAPDAFLEYLALQRGNHWLDMILTSIIETLTMARIYI